MPPSVENSSPQRPLRRIDRKAVLRRLGGDEQLFADLVGFFCEDAPPLLDALLDGIRCGDAKQIARSAHSIKGLAANVGDVALSEAALAVERAARADELKLAKDLSAAVAAELRKSLSELDNDHPGAEPDCARSGGTETADAAE